MAGHFPRLWRRAIYPFSAQNHFFAMDMTSCILAESDHSGFVISLFWIIFFSTHGVKANLLDEPGRRASSGEYHSFFFYFLMEGLHLDAVYDSVFLYHTCLVRQRPLSGGPPCLCAPLALALMRPAWATIVNSATQRISHLTCLM